MLNGPVEFFVGITETDMADVYGIRFDRNSDENVKINPVVVKRSTPWFGNPKMVDLILDNAHYFSLWRLLSDRVVLPETRYICYTV